MEKERRAYTLEFMNEVYGTALVVENTDDDNNKSYSATIIHDNGTLTLIRRQSYSSGYTNELDDHPDQEYNFNSWEEAVEGLKDIIKIEGKSTTITNATNTTPVTLPEGVETDITYVVCSNTNRRFELISDSHSFNETVSRKIYTSLEEADQEGQRRLRNNVK